MARGAVASSQISPKGKLKRKENPAVSNPSRKSTEVTNVQSDFHPSSSSLSGFARAKCYGAVDNCNDASLLLPSSLGLVTTVQSPLPSPPLPPLTLCSAAALRVGWGGGTTLRYSGKSTVLTPRFSSLDGIAPLFALLPHHIPPLTRLIPVSFSYSMMFPFL